MILVAGGTGTLGTRVVRALLDGGNQVRVLTRDAERTKHLSGTGLEVMVGDVRDPGSLDLATSGANCVVSAIQGFAGTEPVGAKAVDLDGNASLMQAATAAGAQRFVLVSASHAAPDSPLELRRVKHQVEQSLKTTTLDWTIVRPTVFMETWIFLLRGMIETRGSVMLFGSGNNPIDFVSVYDVAALVAHVVQTPELAGETLEVGGPQNLTLNAFAEQVMAHVGREGKIHHVPVPVLRLVSAVLRPVRPMAASMAGFGIVMDTTDMTLASDSARARVPNLPVTSLADVLGSEPTDGVSGHRTRES